MHYLVGLGLWILFFAGTGRVVAEKLLENSSEKVKNRGMMIGGWIGFMVFVLLLVKLGLFS